MNPIEHHSKAEGPDWKHLANTWPPTREVLRVLATLRALLLREMRSGIERHPRLRRLRGRWRGWRGRQRRGWRGRPLARHPLLSRWWPRAGIALIVVVLFSNGVVAVRSVQTVRDHDHWVSQAHIMRAQLATLMTDLDDAENGVHTYVITNDTSYLELYNGVEPRLNGELAMLDQLTADNQPQQRRIQALRPLIAADLSYMHSTVRLCASGQIPQAIAQVAAGQGKRALDGTRALVDQMRVAEDALLYRRDVSAAGALRTTVITLALAGMFDLILLVVVLVLVRRSMALREQVAIEHARAETQAQVLALEETTRRMSEFMSIASHELRTPLTSAKANVQLMERLLRRIADGQMEMAEGQVARLRELAVRTERQMNRQARLVSDLLDLSRIQAGKLEMRPELCDLVMIVRDAVQEQRALNDTRRIELTMDLEEEELRIHADADRIGQVLTNYLTNALKYSPRQKPVEVSVERRGKLAYVAVRDAGPGLPPDEQHRVWDRFHRVKGVDVLSGSGIGLGLGLYISKTIIKRHGGRVGVESTPGQGSVFWLTLPLVSERPADADGDPATGGVETPQRTSATPNGVAANGTVANGTV